jgi:Glycosyltransferase family 25 (LPS biosynthesis protein)
MAEAQIPFVFVPAVSKNEVQETSRLTRNQIACAMSHLHAIGLIAEGEDEWGAVFEDDMFVSPEVRQLDAVVLGARIRDSRNRPNRSAHEPFPPAASPRARTTWR